MLLFLSSYGRREIILFSLIWVYLAVAAAVLFLPAIIVPVLGLAFTLNFFRDPKRVPPSDPELMVSPADGTVVEISEVPNHPVLGEDAVKVGVFLSVFNVHVNRAPCPGVVRSVTYQRGRFQDARNPDCGNVNEQNAIHIHGPVPVVVTQIAGAIARRIVCAIEESDSLEKGQRIGMIKFGSRTDTYIPKDRLVELKIQLKDKVKGGETVLARTTPK